MPNWCENTLTIQGSKQKIEEIAKLLTARIDNNKLPGLLSYILPEPDYATTPVPKAYPEITAKYAKTDEDKALIMENKPTIRQDAWWDWRVLNWGTKWEINIDMMIEEYEGDGGYLSLCFLSAWSPPTKAYKTLLNHKGISDVEASFYEPGADFAGFFRNGEEVFYTVSKLEEEAPKHDAQELTNVFGIYPESEEN